MMTLFAVVKDSFREATDRMISRILLILSILIGLFLLLFGGLETPLDEFYGNVAKEAGVYDYATLTPAGEKTFDLSVADEFGAGGDPHGGKEEAGAHAGDPANPLGERLSRAAEKVRTVLERRGVKKVEFADAGGPFRENPPRMRCKLEYDRLDVRGAMKLSVLFGWKTPPLEFDLAGGDGPRPARRGRPVRSSDAEHIFAGTTMREFLITAAGVVVQGAAGWVGLIIAVVATAGFVPSMLAGGTAHLFLAKPVRRSTLLLGKYAGGLAFVFFHASVITLVTAGVVWLRFGWFDERLLLAPVAITSIFAILYAASCLAGVMFETPVLSVMGALALWFACGIVGGMRDTLHMRDMLMPESRAEIPEWAVDTVEGAYLVLPKTRDIGTIYTRYVQRGRLSAEAEKNAEAMTKQVDTTTVIWTSAAFTAILVLGACFVFATKDY